MPKLGVYFHIQLIFFKISRKKTSTIKTDIYYWISAQKRSEFMWLRTLVLERKNNNNTVYKKYDIINVWKVYNTKINLELK